MDKLEGRIQQPTWTGLADPSFSFSDYFGVLWYDNRHETPAIYEFFYHTGSRVLPFTPHSQISL
jgi:hypothetical protein